MEDDQIAELYWQRDEAAVAASAEKYGAYCSSIAGNILSDPADAEECVNDTWFRTWNAMPPHRPSRLALFLWKITRELSIDRWRVRSVGKRRSGEPDLALEELSECISGPADVESAAEYALLGRLISDFLRRQPAEAADLFLRRYWYLDSIAGIARTYRLSESRIKTSLFRTRKRLRHFLEKEGCVW